MQIDNRQFLQIVASTKVQTTNNEVAEISTLYNSASANSDTQSIVEEILVQNKNATIYSIADEVAKNNAEARTNISDASENLLTGTLERKINILPNSDMDISFDNVDFNVEVNYRPINTNNLPTVKYAITIEDMSPSRIANIKQIIYDLHHKSSNPTEPGDDDDDVQEPDEPKPSFIDDFDDVGTMFDWMHEQDPTISKETGLTRAQLVQFTQNDKWEDANYDFFGSLGLIFDVLNKDGDEYLTVEELEAFIGNEIGSSYSSYKAKVDNYALQLQKEFDQLDTQAKLEYAIDMTRDYLEAAGLTLQLKALDRLLQGEDLYNEYHVGQIAFADLNTPERNPQYESVMLLGAYAYSTVYCEYNGVTVSIPVADSDTAGIGALNGDAGLTLDISYAEGDLFELIDTLVHELTHATASNWSNIWGQQINSVPQSTLDEMHEAGALNDEDYAYYSSNLNNLIQEAYNNGEYNPDSNYSLHFSNEKLSRFYYLAYTMWGEYSAYQADADYADSVGADIYGVSNITTAVSGSQEKDQIKNHITSLYPGEAEPDWKWWTYA